ncbi:hypothetical protein [Hafnia paralvei]|uniref:hypothetical protein n=1 Tax=Hafnia paralvei TaxID=546367 RepID=UPI0024A7EE09|nr:hypothetical protein [Hafnia paralvei]
MTKLTTERLEELANATTPSVKYVGREIIAMARQLLAYEQAAKEVACWGVTGQRGQIYPLPPQTARMDSFPLYRAPVLPKQPEPLAFEIIKEAWRLMDGQDPKTADWHFAASAYINAYHDTMPAQPVAPTQPVKPRDLSSFVTDADIAALHRFAECCDDPESGGHDLEKEQLQRLEKIGALQRSGRISYITDFGDYLISVAPAQEQK